ncbi:MAG: undecaprenyldiphospho-muramoylpentapeptide beta-N-acetylglucosaminyltransferase [Chitinophagaceae bacterium]|jgi:UDP-N-acetylglucosamine--N-acetylmuramyl-(pentapeptide) pyrophosphoryl-undecaprenol N-acetylglucosamine transferase|nr:MAG: undecaprenyldiphospho-muramoylpentapeptide beta-N-acetylglucosaminyltransferase [Chitinophagaceae bacterium]
MPEHRIIIAGGGTGGHIFPAIAIARALQKLEPDVDLLFAGANGKMEMEKVPKAGYQIKGLDIAGLERGQWWKNISLPWKIIKSLKQARSIINEFKPDIAVGVGGYSSFPVLRSAQRMGIPTVIQEQNSYAGKSNKILGEKAKKIFVAFDGMEQFFPADKMMNLGNPVRDNIVNYHSNQREARLKFGLDTQKRTLFITGGSLGAKSISEAVIAGLDELLQHDIQLIWQTGKLFYETVLNAVKGKEKNIKVFDFISDMESAYDAADIVISRSGASTIAELCVAGKAVIFVPYPFSAEDHQTKNAMALVNKNAALIVPNAEAGTKLISKAIELFENKELQDTLSNNIKKLAIKNADEKIGAEILKLL